MQQIDNNQSNSLACLPIFIGMWINSNDPLPNFKAGINKMHNAKWTCLQNRYDYWSSYKGNYILLFSRDKEHLCFTKYYLKNYDSITCWPEISKEVRKRGISTKLVDTLNAWLMKSQCKYNISLKDQLRKGIASKHAANWSLALLLFPFPD